MTGPVATRWLRAIRGLAIDLAKLGWKPIRFLIVLTAFVGAGVCLLLLIGQGGALSRDQRLATLGVLAPSLVVVGLVVVPRLRRFSPRETAKELGAVAAAGSRAVVIWFAIALPVGLLCAGIAWVINGYRNGDLFLSTPLGPGICVNRLQDTLTELAPERDPQVEKCTRQGTLFLCFARVLDRGGTYRVAPCSVPCTTNGELTAKYYRDVGMGVDDVCPRFPQR